MGRQGIIHDVELHSSVTRIHGLLSDDDDLDNGELVFGRSAGESRQH